MPRSTTAAETNLLGLAERATHGRVRVDRTGAGAWVDLTDLEDYNWLKSFNVTDAVDSPTVNARIRLWKRVEELSLATLVDASKLNDGGTLLDLRRMLLVEIAATPIDVIAVAADWKELFRGRIDQVSYPGDQVSLMCRDLGGLLMDAFIETQRVYGAAAGVKVEWICQDILDDNNSEKASVTANFTWDSTTTVAATGGDTSEVVVGDWFGYQNAPMFEISAINPNVSVTVLNPHTRTIPTGAGAGSSIMIPDADRITLFTENGSALTPLNPGDSPNWLVKEFKQGKDHILKALRALAQQIGWECRYRWQNTTSAFQLVFYEPDRAKSTPDYTFTAGRYGKPTKLSLSIAAIRNRIRVVYGPAGSRTSTLRTDAPSIAKYGPRYCEFSEASSSAIDVIAEANKMGDAALSDLKEPDVEFGVPVPFHWPVETGDLHRFLANPEHFDTNQDLAVVGFSHEFSDRSKVTTLQTRGQPSGGIKRWLGIQGMPGVAPPIDLYTDAAADNVTVEAAIGSVIVEYDDPRTMTPPVDDWALTECHVSVTPGFTPSGATLKAIGRQTRFEIHGLVPGTLYYAKLKIIDGTGNIGAISTQVSVATQRVGPYHENNDGQFDQLLRNSDLNIYTFDKTTNPPDFWNLYSGATWGAAGDIYYTESALLTGGLGLYFESGFELLQSHRIPFQGGDVVAYGFVARALNHVVVIQPQIEVYGYDAAQGGNQVFSVTTWLNIAGADNDWKTLLKDVQVHDDVRSIEVRISMDNATANGDVAFDRALVQRGHAELWAHKAAIQAYVAAGGIVKVTLPVDVRVEGWDENVADEWTCREPGYYVFDVVCFATNVAVIVGQVHLQVDTGGGFVSQTIGRGSYDAATNELTCSVSHVLELDKGDIVRMAFDADIDCTIQHLSVGWTMRTWIKSKQLTRLN